MKKAFLFFLLSILLFQRSVAQTKDSLENERIAKMVTLSEVVVRTDINIANFIKRVKEDTTFYKAFRNLRIMGFTSLNDIKLLNKKGNVRASMQSKTEQHYQDCCRTMQVLTEETTGDFYDKKRDYNYYTAEMYAGLFFTNVKMCGETNIVGDRNFSAKGLSGFAKHKEQLKMLFFNPGNKIPGIPFIGNKINIFDPEVATLYDFTIDWDESTGTPCYVFKINAKENLEKSDQDKIVIDNMTTWFDAKTFDVMARNYHLSYDAGVYDFDVQMEVQMQRFGQYIVPKTLRYKGNWDVAFKKRERGVFTATLFDFEK